MKNDTLLTPKIRMGIDRLAMVRPEPREQECIGKCLKFMADLKKLGVKLDSLELPELTVIMQLNGVTDSDKDLQETS